MPILCICPISQNILHSDAMILRVGVAASPAQHAVCLVPTYTVQGVPRVRVAPDRVAMQPEGAPTS